MEILPVFWTILGEIAVLVIVVLGAVIWLIDNDRNKLKVYMDSLKEIIKTLKKKIQDKESEQTEERILTLFNQLIDYVGQLHNIQDSGTGDNDADEKLSVEKFIIISLYQTLVTTRNALENSHQAQASWEKINNELTPLIKNYLEPVLEASTTDTAVAAEKHLSNLEKFKQLYFELQSKLADSVSEIEMLNEQIAKLADGSDNADQIMMIIEKNKNHYIHMGQMIGMDKEAHHESVADNMDYSDNLINERKDEINRLKNQVAGQFEKIWALQNKLSAPSSGQLPDVSELNAGVDLMSRQLKDSEMCIETMDMEIQTLSSELSNLKAQLKKQTSSQSASPDLAMEQAVAEMKEEIEKKDQMIAKFAQESKELLSCITGMEDHSEEQSEKIKQLESQLESNRAL